ncbi:hypothetical protein MF406_12740 [Georgenia sp. TF02-10]|uniref:hypothetical protein n=1 Tax=Georgenia sp. TF02-10 TaxID=2917725 RepID=UPI001FA71FD7|nr:hypothetical protein [Georgenia sp. TF02-10]UNX53839.1 hypothetical protein MF406_12740 [Georgenia sp. TF02-10]
MSRPSLDFAVAPVRFSSRPDRMVAFLETVGMAAVLTRGTQFADLVAGAGRVIVHAAGGPGTASEHGLSHLCFITRSADGLVELGEQNGLDIAVVDESYGRQGYLTGPGGELIVINEEQLDDYGYTRAASPQPDPRLSVSALRYSPDFARDTEFFRRLGFEPDHGDGVWWQGLRAGTRSGVIGLHRPSAPGELPAFDSPDPTQRIALTRIGFATQEPLEDLAARLRSAGYPSAHVISDRAATRVHVVDPDGCDMEIHPDSP